MNTSRSRFLAALTTCALSALTLQSCVSADGGTPAERRENIDTMADTTLTQLYEVEPSARQAVADAVGYGVFTNISGQYLFIAAGNGYGVVVDGAGERHYMKMAQGGVGFGLGAKDFKAIFVFQEEDTLNTFIESGWEFGAEAEAAAKSGEKGGSYAGAASVRDGVVIYRLTESGLALQANVAGTKYWKADDLNDTGPDSE